MALRKNVPCVSQLLLRSRRNLDPTFIGSPHTAEVRSAEACLVRSGSQDVWKQRCTMLSSAHQSPPCCWLLTWLSWLVLARLPESHYGGEEFLRPSPFIMQNFHSCYKPPWTVHPCGKEQVCLLPGAMAAGVPGSLKEKVYCLPQRTWKFPIVPHYNLLLQLASQGSHAHTHFSAAQLFPYFTPAASAPCPALLSASVPVPALLLTPASHPPICCPTALLSAWGLGNLLCLLLQQFFNSPPLSPPQTTAWNLDPLCSSFNIRILFYPEPPDLGWVFRKTSVWASAQGSDPCTQPPEPTYHNFNNNQQQHQVSWGNTWNKILLVKNMPVS